jgi:hypothetical protein
MEFPKIKATEKISEVTETYKRKVEASILPPDPARIVELVMRVPPSIEHMLPIPPVLESVHSDVVQPLVESLPRFPLTSEPPAFKFKEWVKE